MKAKIFWKGALIGTLALPLAAVAQTMGNSPSGSDANQNQAPGAPADQKPMGSDSAGTTGSQGAMNPGAANDTTATKEVTGTISKINKHQIVLNAEDGTKMTLHTDNDTRAYEPSGSKVKTTALKEGEQVRASYDMKKDQPHALRIDVIQMGGAGSTGTKQPTTPGNQ